MKYAQIALYRKILNRRSQCGGAATTKDAVSAYWRAGDYTVGRESAQKAAKDTKTDQELGLRHHHWGRSFSSVNSPAATTATQTRLGWSLALTACRQNASGAAEMTTRKPTLAAHVLYPSLRVLRGLLFNSSLFSSITPRFKNGSLKIRVKLHDLRCQ